MYIRYRGGGIGHFPTWVDEPELDAASASLREQEEVEDHSEGTTGTKPGDTGNNNKAEEDDGDDKVDDDELPDLEDGEGEGSDDDADDDILDIEVDAIQLRSELIEDLGFTEL